MTSGRVSRTTRTTSEKTSGVAAPLLQSFIKGLGEAVIRRGGEELGCAVIAVSLKQLFRAHQSQRIPKVRRHFVGAALAAIERQQADARAHGTRFIGQRGPVFVVGVGDDHQHAGAGVELMSR